MNRTYGGVTLISLFLLLLTTGCGNKTLSTRLAFDKVLPEKYNSPDGMTLGDDNCIYLSMNTVNNTNYPGRILRITEDDQIEEVIDLLPHPETGMASPMGLVFGPDGNLYVSDNQSFVTDGPGMSRLLRVVMEKGEALRCEVVAEGFNIANGITLRDNSIYLAETDLKAGTPHKSGVYRLELSELNPDNPVRVSGLGDPHLITVLETKNEALAVGANGIAFNSKGDLFVCNFGDAEVYKMKVDDQGVVTSKELFARGGGMESVDGLQIDKEDMLWIADFIGNAVIKIMPGGRINIVAKNSPSDGKNGELDAPSECIRRGDKVYVSNIDLTFGPNTNDDIHTMSIIELK